MNTQLLLPLLVFACSQTRTEASKPAAIGQQGDDSVAVAVIPPEGGTIELQGLASVIFLSGAFDSPQPVTVTATTSAETQAEYELTADDAPRLAYEIRINSGDVAPSGDFQVLLPVSEAFLGGLPSDRQVELWVQLYETGGVGVLDQFRIFSSEFDEEAGMLRADLPNGVFTNMRRVDDTFEAILVVGSAPAANYRGTGRD